MPYIFFNRSNPLQFLQFDKITEYSPGGFIVSIASAEGKAPTELTKGDKMACVVGGGSMKITPTIVVCLLSLLPPRQANHLFGGDLFPVHLRLIDIFHRSTLPKNSNGQTVFRSAFSMPRTPSDSRKPRMERVLCLSRRRTGAD